MEAFANFVSRVGAAVGLNATVAASAIGVLLAALMVWLGHFVSAANAKMTADLEVDEKTAVIDLDHITWTQVGPDKLLRFQVKNFGVTAAREVTVRLADVADVDAFTAAYAAVVPPSGTSILDLELPVGIDLTSIVVELRYHDYRGRLRIFLRGLRFSAAGQPPRQRLVDGNT